MPDPLILVCDCGKRLKAAGATPGRVGKCPSCGGLLRVPGAAPRPAPPPPEDVVSVPGGYHIDSAQPTTFAAHPGRPSAPTVPTSSKIWDGLIRPPSRPETRLRDSLLYPLWGATGLALLAFLPPALWITTLPFLSVVGAPVGNLVVLLIGLLALLPAGLLLFLVGGYALLFLGRVLVSSALGEVHHPRWPDWDVSEIFRGLGRWIWAILIGGFVGGLPAVAYWIYCGDVDVFDRIILVELLALGAAYAQMALLASILHDDPLGANPITVFRAIYRVKWACLRPSLLIGFALLLAAVGFATVLEISNPPLAAVAYWMFWVGALYGAMVVLRVLGLFYHRHARVLGWFRDRPRWGA